MDSHDLLKLLELAEQRIKLHHEALWKEEVHYTWLSYVLAGGLIFLLSQLNNKLSIMATIGFFTAAIILSIMGIVLCYLGYRVIKKEGRDFSTAVQIRNRLHRALKLQDYIIENEEGAKLFPDVEINRPIAWNKINRKSNKHIKKVLRHIFTMNNDIHYEENNDENGIRDMFRLTMLLPLAFFFIAIPFSITSFVLYLVKI